MRTSLGCEQRWPDGSTSRDRRASVSLLVQLAGAHNDQIDCVAAFTLVGVNGTERSRTPIASKTALEIADGITAADGSPAPQGFSVGRSMRSITTSGTAGKVMIG